MTGPFFFGKGGGFDPVDTRSGLRPRSRAGGYHGALIVAGACMSILVVVLSALGLAIVVVAGVLAAARRRGTAVERPTRHAPSRPGAAASQAPLHAGLGPSDVEAVHLRLGTLMLQGDPAVPGRAPTPAGLEVSAAARRVLEGVQAHPRYMPRRPQVLPQLMRAVNDPEASSKSISGIIQRDPALAATLLRIANSAYYRAHARPVETLDRAVALVGTDGLRQIVSSALVQPVGGGGGGVWGHAMGMAWDHTQASAMATADIARRRGEDAFAAHLLALVHGLGGTVVLQVLRDQSLRRPGQPLDAAACVALWLSDTAATAGRIAQAWQLADRIDHALVEQQPVAGKAAHAPADLSHLGNALYLGRLAGSLAMLVRRGDMALEDAQLLLVQAGEPEAAHPLLERLTREDE
ncbi:HDOD domain-containing protein [Lysobacter sp. A3-1-A15]|uniref:HDOD domain-containing protein n=1 Tax=Novilysobacter viscosus TaxID=3098602 RepID=UPI002ED9800D